jgi:hypothetical protein
VKIETEEYLGVSLVRVVKELAGRVRLLEEVIRTEPKLHEQYERQLKYRAAYEEDEFTRLVEMMQQILSQLPEIEDESA